LLLLDERFQTSTRRFRSKLSLYIRELQKRWHTALYVTHDQEEALSIADTIVILRQGEIMQTGTPEEIYAKPANMFVAEFIGDSTILKGAAIAPRAAELSGNVIADIEIHSDGGGAVNKGDESISYCARRI
jgi:ABC-type Fe3+/spermidine/putrescine transport system ATPase subunit